MGARVDKQLRSTARTETSDVAATGRSRYFSGRAALATIALILSSCGETKSLGPMVHEPPSAESVSAVPAAGQNAPAPEVANAPAPLLPEQPKTFLGTGKFVASTPSAPAGGAVTQGPAGDITLNFVNADVREVLPRVLGDILHLNYTIDPKVQATITVQTSRPLRQQDVLPVLQEVLRTSGLTLVASDGIYRLVASEDAPRSGTLPVTVGTGAAPSTAARPYNVQILPLKYVAATELQHTLEPFVPKSAVMEVDATRNLLILSGTGIDLSTITDMVKAFDVDWISGMSYGIIPVETGSPKSITDQLTTIFGPKGTVPLPGMLSFAPLDRMNAILVVSPQRAYLEQARIWIERLDRGQSDNRAQIYEYHVQNSRAADLAKVVTGLFASGQAGGFGVQPQTAPGTTATQIGAGISSGTSGGAALGGASIGGASIGGASSLTQGAGLGSSSLAGPQSGTGAVTGPMAGVGLGVSQAPAAQGAGTTSDQTGGGAPSFGGGATTNASASSALSPPPARIIADEKNNNIVIFAQPRDYRMIEQALEKLDVVPLQVLIEATIVEVTLTNQLQYGLQYFFHEHENQFIFGNTTTPISAAAPIAGTFPGFNYILGSSNANVVLNLLSSITDVHVVSAPELLVLDHQSASLLVGNEVPIPTTQSQQTVTSGAPLVTTVQYIDTGVILKVSPRVNASGLITLDVSQEVSAVANASSSSLGPTITDQKIDSTITVQDGETAALGGLIQDNTSLTKNGLPVLSDIPVLGALFRSTNRSVARTELLVLLSPRLLHNASDARAATDELRSRLHSLERTDTEIP